MGVIGFILHAKISSKKAVKAALENKFAAEYDLRFYETAKPRHAEDLTETALAEGCDFLIAVGGDGTLNEVVNTFLRTGGKSKYEIAIGVLPFGTGNDFARSIGMNRSVDQLYEIIRRNQPRILDAGALSFTRADGTVYTRFFDNIADVGIGAEVVAKVNGVHVRKRILGGTMTFIFSALSTFMTFRHKKIRIRWDDQSYEGKVLEVVVANGVYFGSGLGIAPEAKMDDGLFELIILGNVGVIDYLKNFGRLRKAEKIIHPEIKYYRTSNVSIEPLGQRAIVEADGEIEGHAPLEFTCLKGALPFLVP